MASVLLKNVTKVFENRIKAVNNAIMEVADQEFMVIVGPSGSGKTTILRMIAGLEELTSGTITIGDRIVNNIPPSDRGIAMVFQNYALYPHMTVFQNMAFGLKKHRYSKEETRRRVAEVAKLLALEMLLDRKPASLSGGQRQRVALGRAIASKPEVFLFDEPLSNLDTKARITTRAELKTIHRKLKTTSIYVTHDQAEAMSLGDRIAVVCDGVIQQTGTPLEIYNEPANRFVAGFLGMPPMNFFAGTIRYDRDKVSFTAGRNTFALPGQRKEVLAPFKNKHLMLGVRPEHFSLQANIRENQTIVSATVIAAESLGDRTYLYLEGASQERFIAKVGSPAAIGVNQRIAVYVSTKKAHVFEPGPIGRNITLSK